MADHREQDSSWHMVATSSFTMDCPNCGPSTVLYQDGVKVHGCAYEPPALIIDCGTP